MRQETNKFVASSKQAEQTPEQRFTEFLSGLDLPNKPAPLYVFKNPSINKENPAYCFYSLMLDKFKCLAAIKKLELENNLDLTNETLFYLMVIPDLAKHLKIINEAEYQDLSKLYQDMFQTLNELENSSGLEVNYNYVNSQIETLQTAGLNIDSISRSVQENSLSR
jgi:hypothetical protein